MITTTTTTTSDAVNTRTKTTQITKIQVIIEKPVNVVFSFKTVESEDCSKHPVVVLMSANKFPLQ